MGRYPVTCPLLKLRKSSICFRSCDFSGINVPEFQGEAHGFDYTFIYGFYGGQLSFLEPMVSLAALEQRQSVDRAIALPEQFAVEGVYPTGYRITYDAAAKQYRIALTHFQE